jgi:Protein of unknown function (DUF2934)
MLTINPKSSGKGVVEVDAETRRKKQQSLMVELTARKVRTRAQQLYDTRGQEEGLALQDWVQAESEVLKNNLMGNLYVRMRTEHSDSQDSPDTSQLVSAADVSAGETA